MARLANTLKNDIRLQYRNGFYYAALFIVAFMIIAALNLPGLDLRWLMPAILFQNLITNCFYFIAGLVLLEKDEGTLEALIVTPLRLVEYLTSKVASLSLLALVENVILVALFTGPGFDLLALSCGLLTGASLLTLAGFISVARYRSINEYLLPSLPWAALCGLPLIFYLAGWSHPLLYLHPLQACLTLIQGAFRPLTAWEWVYSALYNTIWIIALYWLSVRAFDRHILVRFGAD